MGNEIKFKRIFLCVIFAAMCFMFVGIIKVDAMNTGFETEDISVQKKRDLLSRIEISLMIEEPKKGGIQCFDVNASDMIAIILEI